MAFGEEFDLLFDASKTRFARCDLDLAELPVGAYVFPNVLPKKVESLADVGDLRLLFGEANASFVEKCLNLRGELLQHLDVVGSNDEVIRIANEVDVVFTAESF